MDWRMDANNNITACWYNYGVVQLASSYVGNQNGSKITRWSANENKKIEIEWPAMVQKCSAHIGGVDLCHMLLAHYRVCVYNQQNFTCTWFRTTVWVGPLLTDG